MSEETFYNRVGTDRISSRQVDELVGLARGLIADGRLNQAEVAFILKWLAANIDISHQPMIARLYARVNAILADGVADEDECGELLATPDSFATRDFELGEVMKASSLPVCDPAPILSFSGRRYCFTGTFGFGQRRDGETAVATRGSLTQSTDVLLIGMYATETWKHSAFGTKITKAVDWRRSGIPIAIGSERHWSTYL